MSNKLFSVELNITRSPMFIAVAALLTLGVKVNPKDDLGKVSRMMIEAGYLPWLRDAAKDETVAGFITSVTEAAEQAAGEGNEPNFEAAVSALSSELLNYYGGIFGITNGIERDKATTRDSLAKTTQALRQVDHLREVIEGSMKPEEVERAHAINDAIRRGDITHEEGMRQAGAPEELVQAMSRLMGRLTGRKPEAETETQGG